MDTDVLVVGAGPGVGPLVRIFSLRPGEPMAPPFEFFAYDVSFTGGVRVACAVTQDPLRRVA